MPPSSLDTPPAPGAVDAVRRIPLLRADPDFADGISPLELGLAEGALKMPALGLQPGIWEGPATVGLGLVVLDGLLARKVAQGARSSLELFGRGDLVAPEDPALLPADQTVTWSVLDTGTLALLDGRFELAARRWPSLWHVVAAKHALRAQRLASQLAALQLSRVEDRIEAVLWQLADRWGRVTTDGVVIPLSLTQAMVGELVAAKRPTVSLALTALAERGTLTNRPEGGWLLRRTPGELRFGPLHAA